jgi:thiaminase/transcriptional activator TenA
LDQTSWVVPPFATACREIARATWDASYTHPFVRALAEGTLDLQAFRFYQMQDARYLEAYADAAALVSTRCPDPADKLLFLELARGALVVERSLHEGYGKTLGYDAAALAALVLTPNNLAYQNHMISTALRGSLLEAVAALLPCPWLYADLGARLLADLGGEVFPAHPFRDWLQTYADPSLNDTNANLCAVLQRLSDEAAASPTTLTRAQEAFLTSTRYEWLFWEQAWTNQQWPLL